MNSEAASAKLLKHPGQPSQAPAAYQQATWVTACQSLLRRPSSDAPEMCERCLEVFDRLITAEGGGLGGTEGLREVFIRLYFDNDIYQLASSLYLELKNERNNLSLSKKSKLDWAQMLESLDFILSWYLQRARSLHFLSGLESNDKGACLFDVNIVHDVIENGVHGFEIAASARLDGLAGEEVWFEVRMFEDDQPLHVKSSAKGWSQQSLYPRIVNGSTLPFQFSLPLHVSSQVKIFDRLHVFIPYGVIDLESGLHVVDVTASLVDVRGAYLGTAVCPTLLRLVGTEPDSVSPNEVGSWKINTQTGESVQAGDVQIAPRVRGAWEEPGLELNCSGLVLGRANDLLTLETRIVSSDGHLAVSLAPSFADEEGYFLMTQRLSVPASAFKFSNYKISIPVRAFELSESSSWYVEVTLLGRDASVICAVQRKIHHQELLWCRNVDELYSRESSLAERLQVHVSAAAANLTGGIPNISVVLEDLEDAAPSIAYCWITPRWLEAESNRIQSSRIVYGARFDPSSALSSNLRFSIPFGDLARFIGGDSSGDLEFILTAMQFDFDGRCLRCVQDFFLVPSADLKKVKKNQLDAKQDGKIITANAIYDKHAKTYFGELVVNVSSEILNSDCYVYYEVVDEENKPISFVSSGMNVPGRFGVAEALPKASERQGVVQSIWPFKIPLPDKSFFGGGKSYLLRLVLFAKTGAILDSYELPIGEAAHLPLCSENLEEGLASFARLASEASLK